MYDIYAVVSKDLRDLRSYGYPYYLLNGEPRSYSEFANCLIVIITSYLEYY